MVRLLACFVFLLLSSPAKEVAAQVHSDSDQLHFFGYFQNQFVLRSENNVDWLTQTHTERRSNSFLVQQLNLFARRDLGQNNRWRVQVNLEMVNSYSTFLRIGSFNLEEAWVQYYGGRQFKIKLGLQIPFFNELNEIKNRTPLLPYIVRPLVYETSFKEFIDIEEYVPQRAFVQAYGQIPGEQVKFDYAVYFGNTSSLRTLDDNRDPEAAQQTGVDSTDTVLFGFRGRAKLGPWRASFSGTFDRTNILKGLETVYGGPSDQYIEIPRERYGFDAAYEGFRWRFESEYIRVRYKVPIQDFVFDRTFAYATLGMFVRDNLFSYVSYWYSHDDLKPFGDVSNVRVYVPTFGFSYSFPYNIAAKAQYAYAVIKAEEGVPTFIQADVRNTSNYYTFAISVVF